MSFDASGKLHRDSDANLAITGPSKGSEAAGLAASFVIASDIALKRGIGKAQFKAMVWQQSIISQIFFSILLIADVILLINYIATANSQRPALVASLVMGRSILLIIGAFEAAIRVFSYRMDLVDGSKVSEMLDILFIVAANLLFFGSPTVAIDHLIYQHLAVRLLRFVIIIVPPCSLGVRVGSAGE